MSADTACSATFSRFCSRCAVARLVHADDDSRDGGHDDADGEEEHALMKKGDSLEHDAFRRGTTRYKSSNQARASPALSQPVHSWAQKGNVASYFACFRFMPNVASCVIPTDPGPFSVLTL